MSERLTYSNGTYVLEDTVRNMLEPGMIVLLTLPRPGRRTLREVAIIGQSTRTGFFVNIPAERRETFIPFHSPGVGFRYPVTPRMLED